MAKILALRSVTLKQSTQDAWNQAGVKFARRGRSVEELNNLIAKYEYDTVLNLGDYTFDTLDLRAERVFNESDVMRAVTHPRDLRETMNEYLPESDTTVPHWHKRGGYGGTGVRLCEVAHEDGRFDGDVQRHINGIEYRVLTVGELVVQASRKSNLRWENGKHYFDWEWIGVDGIRNNGIIPMVKDAVTLIPAFRNTVLGWDIIVGDRPYVIEINTSPGVNEATADRIVRAMS